MKRCLDNCKMQNANWKNFKIIFAFSNIKFELSNYYIFIHYPFKITNQNNFGHPPGLILYLYSRIFDFCT